MDFITREANAEMTPLVRCWLRVGEDCATTVRNCSTAPTLGASLHAGGEPPSTCGFAEDLPSASSAAPTCSAIACNAVSETPVKAARAAHCSHVPKQRRCQRVASCRTTNPATSQRRLVVAAPMFRESTPPEESTHQHPHPNGRRAAGAADVLAQISSQANTGDQHSEAQSCTTEWLPTRSESSSSSPRHARLLAACPTRYPRCAHPRWPNFLP